MPNTSRQLDEWIGECCCHDDNDWDKDGDECIPMGGFIIEGSGDMGSSAFAQARETDRTIGWCNRHMGFISSSSLTVLANNLGKARVGDGVSGCNQGELITGTPNFDTGG
jgi:uncharacterized Zn-binding protein involved in type VI secretion